MPGSNIEIVREVYDAFLRADIEAVIGRLSADASWSLVGREEDVPFAGLRHGRAGAADFFRTLTDTVDMASFVPREFLSAEDKVFVWGDWEWTMRRTGVSGKDDWLHVFTFRDGEITSFRSHTDTGHLSAAWHAPELKMAASG